MGGLGSPCCRMPMTALGAVWCSTGCGVAMGRMVKAVAGESMAACHCRCTYRKHGSQRKNSQQLMGSAGSDSHHRICPAAVLHLIMFYLEARNNEDCAWHTCSRQETQSCARIYIYIYSCIHGTLHFACRMQAKLRCFQQSMLLLDALGAGSSSLIEDGSQYWD